MQQLKKPKPNNSINISDFKHNAKFDVINIFFHGAVVS